MKVNYEKFAFEDKLISSGVEKEMGLALGKVTHHIHPDIVKKIIEANKTFENEFKKYSHKKLKIENYFYRNSDCLFPGVRRPIQSDKIKNWKNNINEKDGTILNDNTYPRHIWTYLAINRAYSGGKTGSWGKSGLDAFELAHIFSHKKEERELEKKVFKKYNDKTDSSSLFTSVSNVVLIPKGLAKPTDKLESIRMCFFMRHLKLYGNNFLELDGFKENLLPKWYYDIKWLEPIKPKDWEQRVDNLLEFRAKHLKIKYS